MRYFRKTSVEAWRVDCIPTKRNVWVPYENFVGVRTSFPAIAQGASAQSITVG